MSRFWTFLLQKENREVLGWIGGGVVVAAGALWAVFVFFWTPSADSGGEPQVNVEASDGSLAVGGDLTGSTIQIGGSPAE
jgi:hypothetical protein